jgi:hypothetical protein
MLAEAATGQRIVAVRRASSTGIVPERPVEAPGAWHIRRLTGALTPRDPRPIEVTHAGYRLIVDGDGESGNPIVLEEWLCAQGYYASAEGPTACFVAAERGAR